MDFQIALILGQDGITNGAIYALLALALVLVFAVTRVIFIPQGEFVAFGALTLAALQLPRAPDVAWWLLAPGTLWLLLGAGVAVVALELVASLGKGARLRIVPLLGWNLAYPLALVALVLTSEPATWPLLAQVVLALAVVAPMGPMLYRLAYQPLAEATVLVLLIVSVAVHLALVGLGLLFFGAEGSRTPAFSEASFSFGDVVVNGQTLWVVAASLALIVGLYLFFGRSLYGKALRATAINRTGARLMGISTT
ncbi:MAG: branched-chain amino acid ABC transporter permease, partial [Rhodocyclaceae bacterium]|nr:branched-chain amino acid ABC transporter permease [Rhodocyclaceae bacterium]